MKTAEEWMADKTPIELVSPPRSIEMKPFTVKGIRATQADALRWARDLCLKRMSSYNLDSNFYEIIQEIGRQIEDKAYAIEHGEEEDVTVKDFREKLAKPAYKLATKAWHKSCEWLASMPFPDLCYVKEEDDKNFYGTWVCGIGMIDVHFPKETTRDLTLEEATKYASKTFVFNGNRYSYTKEELLGPVVHVRTFEEEKR